MACGVHSGGGTERAGLPPERWVGVFTGKTRGGACGEPPSGRGRRRKTQWQAAWGGFGAAYRWRSIMHTWFGVYGTWAPQFTSRGRGTQPSLSRDGGTVMVSPRFPLPLPRWPNPGGAFARLLTLSAAAGHSCPGPASLPFSLLFCPICTWQRVSVGGQLTRSRRPCRLVACLALADGMLADTTGAGPARETGLPPGLLSLS